MPPQRFIEVFRPVIYQDSIDKAVETLASGWIGFGPRVKEFEEKFSRYIGSKYCVAVNSGTSALHIAVRCLNLPEGSRITTTPITYVSTIHAVYYERCIPEFVDVERRTGNISVESVKGKLREGSRAILCTHLGGYPCDLEKLRDIESSFGIPIVEDCAHAVGSAYRSKRVGDGRLCCFSFSFPKPVTGVEGGAIVTDDWEYAERARVLRDLGIARLKESARNGSHVQVKEVGFRYNWNDVMASISLRQLDHLEEDNNRRKEIAEQYLSELSGIPGVYLPEYSSDRTSSYFFLPLFFDRRDDLAGKLHSRGIGSRIYFRRYDSCRIQKQRPAHLPDADWYEQHELTLPLNVSITDEEVEYIVETVKEGW